MTNNKNYSAFGLESLEFHSRGVKGKIAIDMPKPLVTQKDLSLAYSPGVAAPSLEIARDKSKAFEYTAKGNFVAVISNGTAVLGLGNLGALAAKPVMEGKAILFKRFADIDAIDIEVDTTDPETFISVVKHIAHTWGGINLEDIKAPECFVIEDTLKSLVTVPVFHDDQHGTAIIAAAGLINAVHITKRNLQDLKVVVNGAGAAAIACIDLLKKIGVKHENVILCDTRGVIYKGRTEGMNVWKEKHAVDTKARSLEEALAGADVMLGLSAKGAVTSKMVGAMAKSPIIFALANPDPEITPEEVRAVRSDAIVATGRSDYPNQVNNVMCFPYIFRGALDTCATTINDEMKIAAVHAIAKLARQDIPEEIAVAYADRKHQYGPEYIIPVPFDSRLVQEVSAAVAEAAIRTGVAQKPITDFYTYKRSLAARLRPTAHITNRFFERLRSDPKKMIFAKGEEEQVIKAAIQWQLHNYGEAILVGNEQKIKATLERLAKTEATNRPVIIDPNDHPHKEKYVKHLYRRLQRKGYSYKECLSLVQSHTTIFAAEMLYNNEGDGMVTGTSEGYIKTLKSLLGVLDKGEKQILFALSVLIHKGKTLFIADTAINVAPTAQELADIAMQAAEEVRNFGHEPRVAFVSTSTFGNPPHTKTQKIRHALHILDQQQPKFEYDGELVANVALNEDLLKLYPFCKLSKPASLLIMPGLNSAHISSKLLQEFGGASSIGPILCGLNKRVQITKMGATVTDILDSAAIAATRHIP